MSHFSRLAGITGLLSLTAGLFFMPATAQAAPPSAGCAAINAIGGGVPAPVAGPYFQLTGQPLDEGEVVTLTANSVSATWEFSTGAQGSIPSSPVYPASGVPFNVSFTIPAGGVSELGMFDTGFTGPATFANTTYSCTAVPNVDVSTDLKQASTLVTPQIAKAAVTAHAGFITQVTRDRFNNGTENTESVKTLVARELAASLPALAAGFAQGDQTDWDGVLKRRAVNLANNTSKNMLGGDNSNDFAVWLSAGYSRVDSTLSGGGFDGDTFSLGMGGDIKLRKNFLLGLAAIFDDSNTDTSFNTGEIDSRSAGVSPYFAWQLDNGLTVDGSVGYARADYDINHTGGTVTGSFDADRVFGHLGVTGKTTLWNKLSLTPGVKAIYLHESQDAYTDSAATAVAANSYNLGVMSGAIEAGRNYQSGTFSYRPYGKLAADWAFKRPSTVTLTTTEQRRMRALSGTVALGLSFTGEQISGALEASHAGIGDSGFRNSSVNGTLRLPF